MAFDACQVGQCSSSCQPSAGIGWSDQILNLCYQLFGMKRLCKEFEVIALALGVFQYRCGVSLAGKEEDVAVPKLLADRDCQLDSIHAWHYDVTEDQIRNPSSADFKG